MKINLFAGLFKIAQEMILFLVSCIFILILATSFILVTSYSGAWFPKSSQSELGY